MTSPNHIAGGTLFTGFFCSLYNINIFDDWRKIVAVCFFSLLPDIDLPKSPIGLLFYPIAKIIYNKYGHRTITHSLLFLGCITMATYIIGVFIGYKWLPFLAFWAIFGHLILDLITVQGVPIFYPFMKNPCVIPANHEYRLSTQNPRSEIVAFLLFVVLNFTSIDLFANGFWTTWNQSFGTLDHVLREKNATPNLLQIDYHIVDDGNDIHSTGYLLESNPTHCFLVDNKSRKVVKIDMDDPTQTIIKLVPKRTNFKAKSEHKEGFVNNIEALNALVKSRYVLGSIKSNLPIYVNKGGLAEIKNSDNFMYNFSPVFSLVSDSTFDQTNAQIQLKKLQIKAFKDKYYRDSAYFADKTQAIALCKRDITKAQDPIIRAKIERLKEDLEQEIGTKTKPIYLPPAELLKELELLQQKRKIQVINLSIYYEFTFPEIP